MQEDRADEITLNYGFTQQMSYCPTSCTLYETDHVYSHPSIQMFDEELGTVMISTSDTSLFETMLTLKVTCTSLASEQPDNAASDVFTVKFEDPCQFDKVFFENKAAIEDYYIYYVEASHAKEVTIDHGFKQEMSFC